MSRLVTDPARPVARITSDDLPPARPPRLAGPAGEGDPGGGDGAASAAPPAEQRRHSFRANAAALALGQGATWLLSLATYTMLPRYLGPTDMGHFSIGLSFVMLSLVVGRAGFNTLLTREIAQDRRHAAHLVPTVIAIGVMLGVCTGTVAALIGLVAGFDRATMNVVLIMNWAIPLGIVTALYFAAAQGLERMRYQALVDVAGKTILFFAMFGVVLATGSVINVATAYTLSAALTATVALWMLYRMLPFRLRDFSWREGRALVRSAMPFLWLDFVTTAYLAVDVLLLAMMATAADAGVYQTPFRLVNTVVGVPLIIGTVIFPRMAAQHSAHGRDGELAEGSVQLCRLSLRTTLSVMLPISVAMIGLGGDALVFLVGDAFSASRPVLVVLAITLIPMGANMVLSRLAIAARREHWWTRLLAAMLVLKVVLILALIPLFDRWFDNPALAVALAFLATELVTTPIGFRGLAVLDRESSMQLGKLLLTGALAGAAALAASVWAPQLVVGGLAAGGLTYLVAGAAVRVYTRDEIVAVAHWLLARRHHVPAPEHAG